MKLELNLEEAGAVHAALTDIANTLEAGAKGMALQYKGEHPPRYVLTEMFQMTRTARRMRAIANRILPSEEG